MKRYLAIAALALSFGVAACTTNNIASDVAAAEVALTEAGRILVLYENLQACGSTGATVICKSPATQARAIALFDTAYTAIKKVESSGLAADLTAAQSALTSLTGMTATLAVPAATAGSSSTNIDTSYRAVHRS